MPFPFEPGLVLARETERVGGGEPKASYEAYLARVHTEVFGARASASWVREKSDELQQGKLRRELVLELLLSQPYRERLVANYYQKLLHRSPSSEGMALWTGLLRSGKRAEEILAAIAAGNEYFGRHEGSPEGFVRAIHRDFLGQTLSDIELGSMAVLLHSQTVSRLTVAMGLVHTVEFRERQVREWFLRFLGHAPASETESKWVKAWAAGFSQEEIQAIILASEWYFVRR